MDSSDSAEDSNFAKPERKKRTSIGRVHCLIVFIASTPMPHRGSLVEPGHLCTKQCLAASQRVTGRARTPVH